MANRTAPALLILAVIGGLAGGSYIARAAVLNVAPGHLGTFIFPVEAPALPCDGGVPPANSAVVDDDFHHVSPPLFKKIEAALDWAGDGFTIWICAGTYREEVEIEDRDGLHLIGENPATTIVEPKPSKEWTLFEIEDSDGIEIEGLTIRKGKVGIEVEKSGGHLFHDNVFADNEDAIHLEKTNDVVVQDNDFNSNGDGVVIEESGSAGNTVTGNHFTGNKRGVVLDESDENMVEMNTISTGSMSGTYGILLQSSNANTIVGNDISEKTRAIELAGGSRDNSITGNYLHGNHIAIQLKVKSGKQNTIDQNMVHANETGIRQDRSDGGYGQASIYHNSFMNNDEDADGSNLGSNLWDIGYSCDAPDGGNFWDEHVGTDAYHGPDQSKPGGEGIFDDAHEVDDDEALDHYPFSDDDNMALFVGTGCADPVLTLAADPPTIPADGVAVSVITAVVTNEEGEPIADGSTVTFTTTLGTFLSDDQESQTTTTAGQAVATLVAGLEPGVATVTGTANGDSGFVEVIFTEIEDLSVPAPEPLPETELGVQPILECVVGNGDGSYTAHFGYQSESTGLVLIEVGSSNLFSPAPEERGQPIIFHSGRTAVYPESVFQVGFDGSELIWTLDGRTATASADPELRCPEPTPEPTPLPDPEFDVKINFQPDTAPVPDGYLVDSGQEFDDRGNGYSYGWSDENEFSQDRDSPGSPDQRYDTFIQMRAPENPDASWEIAVPPGSYEVYLVAGDPSDDESVYRIMVEGELAIDGAPSGDTLWFEATETVEVTDGLLTLTNAPGSAKNKICFIEIRLAE
jgi:parallel beta-helix repeat protein